MPYTGTGKGCLATPREYPGKVCISWSDTNEVVGRNASCVVEQSHGNLLGERSVHGNTFWSDFSFDERVGNRGEDWLMGGWLMGWPVRLNAIVRHRSTKRGMLRDACIFKVVYVLLKMIIWPWTRGDDWKKEDVATSLSTPKWGLCWGRACLGARWPMGWACLGRDDHHST